ncbi:MAG: PQQ-dependent sugar dehydrogenase [Candidatus Thiodiazotropha sp. (ex Lucinoma borealis)]|nr:PQQ-dependent sugar dehydrogenase [Candidatus Thiodiazotropha sp. (ex Lucinoma borealis)]MCU7867600.1 PQQ-dependent sugar dehydrogenase [Candidatus Thiodiazotropha sp. (ex Lucinoma borealis)]
MTNPTLIMIALAAFLQPIYTATASPVIQTEKHVISYQVITTGLSHPWSIAFLPDGEILVSERGGNLRLIDNKGNLEPTPITGVPPIRQHGQGGLLDVVIHPDFNSNHWVYFSYAESDGDRAGTTVSRGRLENNHLDQVEVIFQMERKTKARQHFGSRLVFDRQGYLYITLGDRGNRPRAQDLNDHAGSLIRLHDDGRVPKDNPFNGRSGVKPEIYSYGHRNMQGAALNPQTGKVWTHEHGPQGGDEINVPDAGMNYGWPVISYGVNYVIGTKIGEGSHKKGMTQPIHYWVPSIAPSGMAFYTGGRFKGWQGNLFVGSLKFQQLVRLELDGETITHEERLLSEELGRIRDVRQGPDGLIYLITDEENGKLVRLFPSPES